MYFRVYLKVFMAGAFAILLHVTQVLPYILVGMIFLVREGLSLGQLKRRRTEGAEAVGETR